MNSFFNARFLSASDRNHMCLPRPFSKLVDVSGRIKVRVLARIPTFAE
jgi:hypothetical protein